jgi:hypothetical protein
MTCLDTIAENVFLGSCFCPHLERFPAYSKLVTLRARRETINLHITG